MRDLISRRELIKELRADGIQPTKDTSDFIDGWCEGVNVSVDNINNQPTAYDVEKVIEQLTENLNSVETELANLKGVDQQILLAEREHLIGKKLAYATDIDIIRKGGKE